MQAAAIDLARTLTISVGESRFCANWIPKHITWDRLCEKMRTPKRTAETMAQYAAMSRDEKAQVKDVGGFVGGLLEDGSRRAGNVRERQIICLDADFGTKDLWDNWELMVGKAALMHSTHSSTDENPRLRLLVPLSRPVTAAEYEPIARRLAEWVDMDAFDDTTYEPARLMYWPSCSSDGNYIFECNNGDWVDPDEVLATYEDWRDMREWPTSGRQQRVIRKMGEVQGDPLTKPGVVGAFNRAYSITDAIVKYLPGVYVPCGTDRWTFAAGSTTGGAVVYDNDTFLYSHHDTDPTSGRLCNAFDLVRIHLFGDRDTGASADTELGDLPSMKAMRELCAQDESVRNELAEAIRRSPEEVFTPDDGLQRFTDDLTEQGSAVEFVDAYGAALRYTGAFGWLFWDGVKWQTDAEAEAHMLALQFADTLYSQARVAVQAAQDKANKQRAEAALKRAVRLRTSAGQKGLLNQVQVILNDPHPEAYDAQPWDLNTPDGIIDLHTGALRPHEPGAKCTKITAVGVGDGAGAQKWADFIRHITGGDVDFARYLQTLAGMAAVGEVYEEGLVISYGPGGNGKSTFFGALRQVLGDYARGINADVLVASQGRTDQSYVAALRGCRLAVMGETEEGARFGIAQMKRLTSRDVISARQLYKDPIDFAPTHTVIMHTNHLPRLNSLDGGTKRRIAVAPFPATLPPEQVVTNYESVLVRDCGGAILRWIVEGAALFYSAGCKLVKPVCVVEATENYITEEDWLQQFIDECCEIGEGYTVPSGDLYQVYAAKMKAVDGYTRYTRDFAYAMEMKGFKKRKGMSGALWFGLRLKQDDGL